MKLLTLNYCGMAVTEQFYCSYSGIQGVVAVKQRHSYMTVFIPVVIYIIYLKSIKSLCEYQLALEFLVVRQAIRRQTSQVGNSQLVMYVHSCRNTDFNLIFCILQRVVFTTPCVITWHMLFQRFFSAIIIGTSSSVRGKYAVVLKNAL